MFGSGITFKALTTVLRGTSGRSPPPASSSSGPASQHRLDIHLGHVDIKQTYWYLEATPELLAGIAATAERLVAGGGK